MHLTTSIIRGMRYNPTVRWLFSSYLTARHSVGKARSGTKAAWRIIELCRAARLTPLLSHRFHLESEIRERLDALNSHELDWDELFPKSASRDIQKAIILKPPNGPHEKGVLLVAFEDHWLRLLRHADLERLSRDYHLLLSPTWSPPYDLPMLLAEKMWPGRLFTLVSNLADLDTFARFLPGVTALPLLASNWVNADLFAPQPGLRKEHDIVMLANFAAYKRHYLLFSALRDAPRKMTALLLGVPWENRDADELIREARQYGVEDQVTIRVALPQNELIAALQSARVSIITTANEGSCVAVTESLLADVPVGIFNNARIGSSTFINEHTGRFFSYGDLTAELAEFVTQEQAYHPRRWALTHHIDCKGSTRKRNSSLREKLTRHGEVWTRDIIVHHWRPIPVYYDPADKELMHPFYERFPADYGIRLKM
jgi:glycosyltransferase involved in cell wall biosynthesis